jgi:hypothetical protein
VDGSAVTAIARSNSPCSPANASGQRPTCHEDVLQSVNRNGPSFHRSSFEAAVCMDRQELCTYQDNRENPLCGVLGSSAARNCRRSQASMYRPISRSPERQSLLNATAMGRAFGKSSLSIGCHSFPKRTVYAPQKKIKVMTIHLVAERSSSAFESKPQRLSCLFTDTECTCGEHLEQSGCVDFVFDDPEREPKFKPRDCAPAMICDCEGTSVCSKTTVTGSVWKARWAVEAHIPTFRYLASLRQRSRMRI